MLAILKDIKALRSENWMFGDKKARELRRQLKSVADSTPTVEVVDLHFQLAIAELNLGNEKDAIELLTKSRKTLIRLNDRRNIQRYFDLVFRLGVAYMRLGETQNCCLHNNPDSCLLPIQGGGIHSNQEGSTKAIACFQEIISLTELDSPANLQIRWLLNLAYVFES